LFLLGSPETGELQWSINALKMPFGQEGVALARAIPNGISEGAG
jgi:hypothetical protein